MKLQCKNDLHSFSRLRLSAGKIYNVTKTSKNSWIIEIDCPDGYFKTAFSKISLDNFFYTLAETRKLKLEKLYDI